jgi:hypothetical protein
MAHPHDSVAGFGTCDRPFINASATTPALGDFRRNPPRLGRMYARRGLN